MTSSDRPNSTNPKSLSGLLPFLRPYRGRIGLALLFLVLAAGATLAFPVALRSLIDGGLVQADKGAQVMALREHSPLNVENWQAIFASSKLVLSRSFVNPRTKASPRTKNFALRCFT